MPFEKCFVFYGNGKLRANANGRKRFGERFRRAGFDIDKISTFDELEAALYGSWHIVVDDMRSRLRQEADSMDPLKYKALHALLDGDYDTSERLFDKYRQRRASKLHLVKK